MGGDERARDRNGILGRRGSRSHLRRRRRSFVSGPVPGLLSGLAGGLATHIAHRGPVWLASLRRTRALGAAPGLVGRLVLRMRLDPSTERAVRFATDWRRTAGRRPRAPRASERTPMDRPAGSGFARPRGSRGFRPSIGQRRASERRHQRRPSVEGGVWTARALDDATISGTTDRLAAFVGEVRSPVSALYAFGVVSPPCAHCSPSGGCRDGRPNRSRRRRGAVPRRAAGGTARGVGMAALPSPGRVRAPYRRRPPPDVPERNSRRGRRIGNRSHRRRRYSAVRLRMGRSGRRGRRRSRRRAVRCRSPPQSGAVERPCRRALPQTR